MLSKILLSLGNILKNDNSYRYLNSIIKSDKLSKDECQEQQRIKMKELVAYCYRNVPYYKELFDNGGILPQDIQTLDDYKKIPTIDKSIIVSNRDSLISSKFTKENLLPSATGGSSGDPLRFYRSKPYIEMGAAGMWRAFSRCGWEPGDNIGYVWACSKDYYKKSAGKKRLSALLTRMHYMDVFHASEENLAAWVKLLRRVKPTVIFGYASSIDQLAQYMLQTGQSVDGVKGIFTTSEKLFPDARKNIESAFESPVYSYYGSCEVLNIACECGNGNMHINTDYVLVEEGDTISDDGNRELIVTSLIERSMPLLRYKNGDMGGLSNQKCSCGLPTPLLDLNIGRVGNIITFSNGNRVSDQFFALYIREIKGVKTFQLRQDSLDNFTLSVVKGKDFDPTSEESLNNAKNRLKQKAGESAQLSVTYVDSFPLTSQGKHRYFVSNVN